MTKLAVVGGGRMGEALLSGLLAAQWAPPNALTVVEAAAHRRATLMQRFPGVAVSGQAVASEGAVIAVKPRDVAAACGSLDQGGRVLSIAAGVSIAALELALPAGTPVVRAMPNTPSLVGAGAAAIAPGTNAGPEDLAWAESILGSVGIVVRVTESMLDAVTGLSGSGPAYLFLLAEAMVEAGVLNGLPRDVSLELVKQTILGSARLLVESGESIEALRSNVTSPGGTTAAGLRVLEQRAVRGAVLDAVTAAAERSRSLGSS